MTNKNIWPLGVSGGCDETSLKEYALADIHFMELSYGAAEAYQDMEYTKNAKTIFARAKSFGVTPNSIHLPFYSHDNFHCIDPTSPDAAVRKGVLALQSELLRAAGDSGIRIAVIHPSNEPYTDDERPDRIARCIEVMDNLTAVAAQSGIILALENLPRTCICRVREEMLQILAAVPALRVCFDTNHCLMQTNPDYIRAVGKKIVTLHVSDYDFIDERHYLPGMGKNPWNEICAALEESDYNGVFNYEINRTDPVTKERIPLTAVKDNFIRLINGEF